MTTILEKIGILVALCIPLLVGLVIVLIGIIFELEIDWANVIIGFPILGIFTLTTFLIGKNKIMEALKS